MNKKPSPKPPTSGSLLTDSAAQIFADARESFQLERYKAEVTRWLDDHRDKEQRERDWQTESFRSTDRAGTASLAAALVINGSAAIAVLGALAKGPIAEGRFWVVVGLTLFSMGVVLASCGAGAKYVSQSHYTNGEATQGNAWKTAAIALWLGSMAVFAMGCGASAIGLV